MTISVDSRYLRTAAFSAELRLAVACCSPLSDPERLAATARAVNWPRFVATIDRHRIAGLAARALAGIAPGEAAAALAKRAQRDAAASLRAAAAIANLEPRFDAAGVRRLHLKGLTLSVLAYGDPFLKASADIDLLVDPVDIPAAAEVLADTGFVLAEPARLPQARLGDWHLRHKESVWFRWEDGVVIDLHSRLADSPALFPLTVSAPSQRVAVASGLTISTLASEELLVYLAIHGASSCWFRLKWIADFAALRETQPSLQSVGDRSMAQALLLADVLFETGIGEIERDILLSDPVHCRMLSLALDAIAAGEPTERRFGTLPIHRNQLLMRPGLRFVVGEAWRQFGSLVSNRLAR